MTLSHEVQKAAEWLQRNVEDQPFSEVGFMFAVHRGNIVKTEFTLTIKAKPGSEEITEYELK